jgi:uncharacterized glyoxalase superfamily protein PhnB
MAVKPIPDGYHTVTPYLLVPGAAAVIDFLKRAFDAQEKYRMTDPGGRIAHAELRVGDSAVMLGELPANRPATAAMFYLYVPNVDATYQKALDAGGQTVRPPQDEFYGDRSAGVRDSAGNQWWIATHVKDVSDEEMKQHVAAAKK